jgi:hypothetical protein
MNKVMIEDMGNMEDILIRLESTKEDIWQNNLICAMAKAIYHILDYIRKHE